MAVHVEILDRVEPVASEWDELADRLGATPWLRAGWTSAWWRAFGRGTLHIAVANRDERVTGVLPMYRWRGAIRSPTNWNTHEFGFLAEDDEVVAKLVEALFVTRSRRVSLAFLAPGQFEDCLRLVGGTGYRLLTRTIQRSPYVALDGDWMAYADSLDSKFMRDLRRRRRRIEAEGTVSFHVEDGSDRLDELLEEGFAVEASGWKGQRGTAISSRLDTRRFYTEIGRWAADQGFLRLAFLRLAGRPIAFEYGFEANSVYHFVKGGYDPAYQRFAPAKLLVQEMLARAFSIGLTHFEFLGSDEAWKLEWTHTLRERMLVQAFAPSATGFADWAAFAYGRPLAKRLLALHQR